MSEAVGTENISEIGADALGDLARALTERENERFNSVGWGGTVSELKAQVNGGHLFPASAFAVVAEGISTYKRTGPEFREDTDSLRRLADALLKGSQAYGEAGKIDEKALKDQIKKYLASHGKSFDGGVDWQDFIRERSEKLRAKANAIDEVNR